MKHLFEIQKAVFKRAKMYLGKRRNMTGAERVTSSTANYLLRQLKPDEKKPYNIPDFSTAEPDQLQVLEDMKEDPECQGIRDLLESGGLC